MRSRHMPPDVTFPPLRKRSRRLPYIIKKSIFFFKRFPQQDNNHRQEMRNSATFFTSFPKKSREEYLAWNRTKLRFPFFRDSSSLNSLLTFRKWGFQTILIRLTSGKHKFRRLTRNRPLFSAFHLKWLLTRFFVFLKKRKINLFDPSVQIRLTNVFLISLKSCIYFFFENR